jgi:hypothetical protein
MDEIERQELGVSDQERRKRLAIMDQRSGAALKKKWEQGDRQALDEREAALAPPRIVEPKCRVCQSEYRDYIEKALVEMHSYENIAEKVPPLKNGKTVDRRSISNHYKKHMDLERQGIRAELEEEARVLQQNVDTGTLGARTDRGMLKVMASKAFKDIIKGVTTVEPKDLISIIKLLNELNSNAAGTRAEENEIALRTFVRSIQVVCTPEQITKIVQEAERIRGLDDVSFEMEGIIIRDQPEEPLLLEAEVIDAD